MQYRIWSEMIINGICSSLTEPPNTSMFQRAGGNVKSTAKLKSSNCNSPAKIADIRTKCYKQLSDLNTLKGEGILTEEEYMAEKSAIMSTLKGL